MKFILDTQLLLWAAGSPERIPVKVQNIIEDRDNTLCFSSASIWEIVIKKGLERKDFQVDARALRRGLIENEYQEIEITTNHILELEGLPLIHKDPFDRILIAQARFEGITFLTTDSRLSEYNGPIRVVR